MDDQTVQQTIVVTQNAINPNRSIEKKSFFIGRLFFQGY